MPSCTFVGPRKACRVPIPSVVTRCGPCASCSVSRNRSRRSCSRPRGTRRSLQAALRAWWSALGSRPSWASRLTPTCCDTPAGSPWLTKATIPGRCRLTSATATSSTPCDTPSSRRAGSRTSGGDLPPKVDGCALKLPRNGSCLASLRGHNIYINAIMSPIVVRVYRPVTVRPRQRSALTLSDGCLICLTGTALLRAVVPASVHHARRPRFVPIHLRMTQLVVGCSVNGMFGFGRPPFAQSP